jgi:uncharacterized protein (DUF3820 family)
MSTITTSAVRNSKICFGKYKGRCPADLPVDYMVWLYVVMENKEETLLFKYLKFCFDNDLYAPDSTEPAPF